MKDLFDEFNLFAKQQLIQHFEDEKQKLFNELVQKIEKSMLNG